MAEQKQVYQREPTYSSSVRIRGETLRTCDEESGGERGSEMSVLMAPQDEDDDMYHWSNFNLLYNFLRKYYTQVLP